MSDYNDAALARALTLYIDNSERSEQAAWERFAAMALAGFCAAPQTIDMQSDADRAERAADAADAMMAQRKRRFG